jgi:methyl-accepting chemotaxis protein
MKWTVGTKIGTGFSLALVILMAIGSASYRSTNKLTETADWVDHTHIVLEKLSGTLQALTDSETGMRGYLLTADENHLEPYNWGVPVVQKFVSDIRELTQDNPREQQRLDVLEPLVAQELAVLKEGIDVERSKGSEAGRQWAVAGQDKKHLDAIRKVIADMKDEEHGLLTVRSKEAEASAQSTRLIILAGTACAFVVLAFVTLLITRNIARPLREITATAERIAAGDLSIQVHTDRRRDEVGTLAQAFGRMNQSLRQMAQTAEQIANGDLRIQVQAQSSKDMLGNAFVLMVQKLRTLTAQISEGVNVLSASANQISTSTTQLASSSMEMATAVGETTTTVEEVRQTAQLASQKARSVSESAQKMSRISESGAKSTDEAVEGIGRIRQQMESVGDTMVRLSDQSQTIGQIVATVEDLAAQSNLLAVNAAIEAAKAGEHGRGFAVVAQEVKSLAEQSQQATNQVRNILADIRKATTAAVMATEQGSKAVEVGVKQSDAAGQSIQALSASVTEAAQAATQIAASSQQQLVGMDQVATAMENIKQASTQNVASSRQLESAARDLKDLGQRLKQTVETYKI